jgi:hypothetical protein
MQAYILLLLFSYYVSAAINSTVMYGSSNGLQYVDKNGEPLFDVRPMPKMALFTFDFFVRDSEQRIVAIAHQRFVSKLILRSKWDISYIDNQGNAHQAIVKFPFTRYLAEITIDKKYKSKYKIQGNFKARQYSLISKNDGLVHAEAGTVYGSNDLNGGYKLWCDNEISEPLMVAIQYLTFKFKKVKA